MYKHLKYYDCCQFKSKAILWEAALMLLPNEARLVGSFLPWPLCLPTGVPWAHLGALWASVSCCMVGKMMPGLFLIRVKWNHKWTTLTNRTFRRNVKGFLLLTHMPTPNVWAGWFLPTPTFRSVWRRKGKKRPQGRDFVRLRRYHGSSPSLLSVVCVPWPP